MESTELLKISEDLATVSDLAHKTAHRLAKLMQGNETDENPSERIEKSWNFEIIEKQAERQVVYGVILQPDLPDSQGDVISEDEIITAAHQYMVKFSGQADLQHEEMLARSDAVLVESFIAWSDIEWNGKQIRKGSWVGGMWVPNEAIWADVKKGKIRGFSIRGIGKRKPVKQ